MNTHDRLRQIFIHVLDLQDDAIVDYLAYRQTDTWDSLAHMSLIAAIEEEFDVQLSTDQVIGMSNFSKAFAMLGDLGCHD